jgi:hypothetical protein
MTPKQRGDALTHLAHAQATAAALHTLLSRVSDVREPDEGGTWWCAHVQRAKELLGKALAEISRYAVV